MKLILALCLLGVAAADEVSGVDNMKGRGRKRRRRRPTHAPTPAPSHEPTHVPSPEPTHTPTPEPTHTPTPAPSNDPTIPTPGPTVPPTHSPSVTPSMAPSMPTTDPTIRPTHGPSILPTTAPTAIPTPTPTECPDCPACVLCPPGSYSELEMSWEATTEIKMTGYTGHFWPAVSGDAAQITQCEPRELNSCGECSCSGSDVMCFGCAASQSLSAPYDARPAKNTGVDDCFDDEVCDDDDDGDDDEVHYQDEDDTDDDGDDGDDFRSSGMSDDEAAAVKRASKALAESECFICEGFSAKTCTTALTTVISNLKDASRLSIEKELLDTGAEKLCGAGSGGVQTTDEECLVKLDSKFSALETSDKLDLMGSMCELVENSAGLGSSDAEAKAKGALGVHETKAMAKAAVKAAKLEAAKTPEGMAKLALKKAAKEAKQVADEEAKVAAAAAAEKAAAAASAASTSSSSKSSSSSCSMCKGFSDKTCALALTNVITGLDDSTRLDIHTELLSAPTLCAGVPGASAQCLTKLDSAFEAMAVGEKMQLVGTMCALLESAEEEESASSSEASAAAHLSATDDEATTAAAHALNTRNALLAHTTTTSSSSSSTKTMAAAATKTSVQIEALLSTVDEAEIAEPQCLLCEGLSDRVCLAALDASYDGLTDRQRLSVAGRSLSGYPTFTSCGDDMGDLTCLATLDASFATLSDEDRLHVLKDACTMGAYGAAAVALATTSAAATGPASEAETSAALAAAASGSGSSGFAPGSACTTQFCSLAKAAASLAADAFAAKGGVAFLLGEKKQQVGVGGWKKTLGHLATAALPSVTATKDTASFSLGGPAAGGVSLVGMSSQAMTSLSAVSATSYRALKTTMFAATASGSSTSSSSNSGDADKTGAVPPILGFFGGALAAMAFASTFFAIKRNFGSRALRATEGASEADGPRDTSYVPVPEASDMGGTSGASDDTNAASAQPAFVVSL